MRQSFQGMSYIWIDTSIRTWCRIRVHYTLGFYTQVSSWVHPHGGVGIPQGEGERHCLSRVHLLQIDSGGETVPQRGRPCNRVTHVISQRRPPVHLFEGARASVAGTSHSLVMGYISEYYDRHSWGRGRVPDFYYSSSAARLKSLLVFSAQSVHP